MDNMADDFVFDWLQGCQIVCQHPCDQNGHPLLDGTVILQATEYQETQIHMR